MLAQHFIEHQQPFIGFDTDRSHGALLRFYGDYAAPMPLDAHDSLDRVIEAVAEKPERRVLVDLAAQTPDRADEMAGRRPACPRWPANWA